MTLATEHITYRAAARAVAKNYSCCYGDANFNVNFSSLNYANLKAWTLWLML